MSEVLRSIAAIVNELHDLVNLVTTRLGLPLSDGQLHFLVFGLFGLIAFILVDAVFRRLAKWSVSLLSFLYTGTLLAVLALSVEIQQRLTGRGAMDFADLVAGVWGFLVLTGVYIVVGRIVAFLSERRGKGSSRPNAFR